MKNGRLQIYLAGKVRGAKWNFAKTHHLNRIADYFSSDAMDDLDLQFWNHNPPSTQGLDWVSQHEQVKEHVIKQLKACDLLLAYLDTSDAYGTIAEIAYASALDKPVFVVFKAPIENETLYSPPEKYEIDGENPDDFFEINPDEHYEPHEPPAFCKATDAYWLVCCFPNVETYREHDDLNLNREIIRLWRNLS